MVIDRGSAARNKVTFRFCFHATRIWNSHNGRTEFYAIYFPARERNATHARYGCRRAFSAGNAFEKSLYDALDKVKVKSNPIAINKTRNWNARTKNRGKSAAKVKTRKGKTDGQREC